MYAINAAIVKSPATRGIKSFVTRSPTKAPNERFRNEKFALIPAITKSIGIYQGDNK